MLERTSLSWKKLAGGMRKLPAIGPRRDTAGWNEGSDMGTMRQPQDGAERTAEAAVWPAESGTWRHSLGEPEDAILTGGTRSLGRRLLGMNLGALQHLMRPAPVADVTAMPAQTGRRRVARALRTTARVA